MSAAAGGYIKDPGATLDYTCDWEEWLDGDTIVSSSWSVPTGITNAGATYTTTSATVKLSGGTAGASYTVRNTITTAAGRIDVRSLVIEVRTR